MMMHSVKKYIQTEMIFIKNVFLIEDIYSQNKGHLKV